jgi:ElaB/YqjD/DUF883 family membrane-anchored ribosome-binding protein
LAAIADINEVTIMDTNLGSTVRHVEERVEEQVKGISRRVQTAAERVVELVKEYPATSLACAFGVGYLIARVARRD